MTYTKQHWFGRDSSIKILVAVKIHGINNASLGSYRGYCASVIINCSCLIIRLVVLWGRTLMKSSLTMARVSVA